MNPEHASWILSSATQERRKQQDYRRFKDERRFDEASTHARHVYIHPLGCCCTGHTQTRLSRAAALLVEAGNSISSSSKQ